MLATENIAPAVLRRDPLTSPRSHLSEVLEDLSSRCLVLQERVAEDATLDAAERAFVQFSFRRIERVICNREVTAAEVAQGAHRLAFDVFCHLPDLHRQGWLAEVMELDLRVEGWLLQNYGDEPHRSVYGPSEFCPFPMPGRAGEVSEGDFVR